MKYNKAPRKKETGPCRLLKSDMVIERHRCSLNVEGMSEVDHFSHTFVEKSMNLLPNAG